MCGGSLNSEHAAALARYFCENDAFHSQRHMG